MHSLCCDSKNIWDDEEELHGFPVVPFTGTTEGALALLSFWLGQRMILLKQENLATKEVLHA